MGIVVQSGAVAAVAAVTGATIMATPVERAAPSSGGANGWSTSVDLTASTRALHPLGVVLAPSNAAGQTAPSTTGDTILAEPGDHTGDALRAAVARVIADEAGITTEDVGSRADNAPMAAAAEDPAVVADQIDDDFIAFRIAVRTDFHEFANQLGYLGKQMYIAFNFGESILASAIFNGTDVMRGEGLFENLGEFAYDVVLSVGYIAVDQLYLAIPGLPPIDYLPGRPPLDRPLDWMRPLPPQPGRDLVLPVMQEPATVQAIADAPADPDDDSAPEEDTGSEDSATDEDGNTDEGSDAGEESESQKGESQKGESQKGEDATEGDDSERRENRGDRLSGAEKRAKGETRQADTSSDETRSAPSKDSDSDTKKSTRKSASDD
ncbi:MAG: hypothetical protein WBB00_13475 [Mycobacterium sp.]